MNLFHGMYENVRNCVQVGEGLSDELMLCHSRLEGCS